MISGIQKIAVYDPATGTVVQLNKVVPNGEAEIASPLSYKDVDGKNKYDGDKSFLSFGAYDEGGYAQLVTWMKAKTPVRVVMAGIEENLVWYESAPILVSKSYSFSIGNRNYFSVQISKEGGTHNIKTLTNLMLAPGLWYDANSDGVADGLIKSGTFAPTFSNSLLQQTATADVGETGFLYNKIEFPISGPNVFMRFNRANTPSETFYTCTLLFRNFADSTIQSTYGESVNAVAPASTYYWMFSLNINSPSETTQSIICNIPYLGMNRKSFTDINY